MGVHEKHLWNESVEVYKEDYYRILFEQYKLYVEMTDQISSRRQNANTFFLSINTALITGFGYIMMNTNKNRFLLSLSIALCCIIIDLFWFQLIISYKNLNRCKFGIINLIEKELPIRPYFTEWQTLDEGKNMKKYNPVTLIERWIPIVFVCVFIIIIIWSKIC